MEAVRLFKSLDRDQRNTFVACFLGWALDAFDFFLLTFVIAAMAHDFGTSIAKLSYAITLTLAMRRLGHSFSGCLAVDCGGRFRLWLTFFFFPRWDLLRVFPPNSPGFLFFVRL